MMNFFDGLLIGLVIGLSVGALALYKVWRAGTKALEKRGEADEFRTRLRNIGGPKDDERN